MALTWWHSPDTVSTISIIAQIVGAFVGIVIVVFGIRSSQLQEQQQQKAMLEIAKANQTASTANAVAAQLENDAAQARIELARLKERQRPRTVSIDQRTALLDLLKDCNSGTVFISANRFDGESVSFAKSLFDVLFASKVSTKEYADVKGMVTIAINEPGLIFVVPDAANPPPIATCVMQAFRGAGIPGYFMNANNSIGVPPDSVLLWVSRKP